VERNRAPKSFKNEWKTGLTPRFHTHQERFVSRCSSEQVLEWLVDDAGREIVLPESFNEWKSTL
jgi:hypothetical protein